jgi:hypothetical protein
MTCVQFSAEHSRKGSKWQATGSTSSWKTACGAPPSAKRARLTSFHFRARSSRCSAICGRLLDPGCMPSHVPGLPNGRWATTQSWPPCPHGDRRRRHDRSWIPRDGTHHSRQGAWRPPESNEHQLAHAVHAPMAGLQQLRPPTDRAAMMRQWADYLDQLRLVGKSMSVQFGFRGQITRT